MQSSSLIKNYKEHHFRYQVKGKQVHKIKTPELNRDALVVFSKTGNLEEKTLFDREGNVYLKRKFDYNSADQLIEKLETDAQGFQLSKAVYRYKNNVLTDKRIFDFQDHESSKWEFIYDSTGQLIEKIRYGIGNRLVDREEFTYDDHGQLIEFKRLNLEKEVELQKSFVYDSAGNCREEKEYNAQGEISYTQLFFYDDKNQLIELKNLDRHKNPRHRKTFQYDEFGNRLEENIWNAQDEILKAISFEYRYDSNRNWIEKKELHFKVPKSGIVRELNYW